MTNLQISPAFKEITSTVGSQPFSVMYFGKHCGRNILVVQHDITLMIIFKNDDYSLKPDFIKSVSSKGVAIRGIQIVGSENVLLLLDDTGGLWHLINAFEFDSEKDERLYLLDEKCFYEWVPFKKFNLWKVLALSACGCGFACLGIRRNSERKLVLLPSADSDFVKDFTFDEVRSSQSPSFYLTNVKIINEDSASKNNFKSKEEKVLISDRLTGNTYLCSEDGKSTLINYSNSFLVSALYFKEKNCLLLCFQSGKLIFSFMNSSADDCVVFLPKKIILIEECCCFDSCLLWSDGIVLHHTKLIFQCSKPYVKLIHLELHCNIEKPISFVRIQKDILAVTINNIYYQISAGSDIADKIEREPEELLSEIYEGSLTVHELNTKIDRISHFLDCKELVERGDMQERVKMSLEQNCLTIKFNMEVNLRKEFWKVRLMRSDSGKQYVKMAELETDVSEGMVIRVENPWGSKGKVRVSLVGDFDGEGLFVELGEVGGSGNVVNELSKQLEQILISRNPFLSKE